MILRLRSHVRFLIHLFGDVNKNLHKKQKYIAI